MADGTKKLRFAVCVNMVRGVDRPCCGGRGSLELLKLVEDGVRARKLNVDVERIVCLNKCFDGPNMRIVGGEIFGDVGESDIGDILDRLEALAGKAPASAAPSDDKIIFPGA